MRVCVYSLWGLTLVVLAYASSIVFESERFKFICGTCQDGFWAPIIAGSPEVNRFYFVEGTLHDVLRRARLELTTANGWKDHGAEDLHWYFSFGNREGFHIAPIQSIIISPIPGRSVETSIWVSQDATKPEEILGTIWQWIPDRFADFR